MSKIAKRLGLKVTDTHMGMFDFSIRCVIGDHDKALEYIAHVFDDTIEEMPDGNRGYEARGICYFRTGYIPIIWLPRYPQSSREISTLAHECIHAVNHLFDWAAVPLSKDTEETFAHAVGHAVNNILEKMRDRPAAKKPKKREPKK